MPTRVTRETIHFRLPFALPETGDSFPAGRYEVEFEEERMEGLSFTAWRIVRTTLRRSEANKGLSFAVDVRSEALKAAIADDAAHPNPPIHPGGTSGEPGPAEPTVPDSMPSVQARDWRDLIVPPIVVPAAIAVAAIAAFIFGPFQ